MEQQYESGSDAPVPPAAPRAWTVLGVLAMAALTFSYLGAYAVTNALVAEHVISPLPRDHDPRPRWLLVGFCVLMLTFMLTGEVLRRVSGSEMKRIDEMAEAVD